MEQIISSPAAMDIYKAAFMMGVLSTVFWRVGVSAANVLLGLVPQKRK
jgi:hypothetical protein